MKKYEMNTPSPPLVVTLLEQLGSNVNSKFHENRGILKPNSQNHNNGVFHS